MPELVTLDCSFTLVLRGLNTQPYTDGSSTREGPALLSLIIYREINNYSLHKIHKNYIQKYLENCPGKPTINKERKKERKKGKKRKQTK